jgi:hypothetical protein
METNKMRKIKMILCLLFIVVAPVNAQEWMILTPEGESYYHLEDAQDGSYELEVPFFDWHGTPDGWSVYDITNASLKAIYFETIDTLNGTNLHNGTIRYAFHLFIDSVSTEPFVSYITLLSKGQSMLFPVDWDLGLTWQVDDWGNRSATISFHARLYAQAEDEWTSWARVKVVTHWEIFFVQSPDPLYPIEILLIVLMVSAVVGLPTFCYLMRKRRRRQIEEAQEKAQESRRQERLDRKWGKKRK